MEADWEVEIGAGAPVIEACWPGFVDLRQNPNLAWELAETTQLPGLADALVRINSAESPFWTSKCDVWPLQDREGWDAAEMNARAEHAKFAWACYIDLLPSNEQQWITHESAVGGCKFICSRLHEIPLDGCRADLILREAWIAPGLTQLGVTAYLTACGRDPGDAKRVLSEALARFSDALIPASTVE